MEWFGGVGEVGEVVGVFERVVIIKGVFGGGDCVGGDILSTRIL